MTAPASSLLRRPALRTEPVEPAESRDVDLVVNLAHDLRSPLSSILVLAEAMRGGSAGPVTDEQRRQLGIIYAAALRLCSTASDVVEVARGSGELVEPRPAPFDAAEVLCGVRDMVATIAEEKRIKLIVTPPVIAHRLGHARALSRVLLNLATNALKFTDKGFVEIAAREMSGDRRLEFSVTDTGRGFEPTMHRPGPMFGLTRARRHFCSGTGLGLAICRKLVGAMGGCLEFETQLGRGTRFHFTLEVPPHRSAR